MNSTIDLQPLIDNYTNLLIKQYYDKPKAKATIAAIIQTGLANGIFFQIGDAFNIDTAVGAQLDIIGKWVGVDRLFTSSNFDNLPAPLFSFLDTQSFVNVLNDPQDYPPNIVGFGDQANFNEQIGKMVTPSDYISSSQKLNDTDYRVLLKFKILCNTINTSFYQIYEGLYKYFEKDVIVTLPNNMAMDVWVNTGKAQIAKIAFEKNAFPRPMGVYLRFIISYPAPFFSFLDTQSFLTVLNNPQDYPPNIVGFGDTADFNQQIGKMMSSGDII